MANLPPTPDRPLPTLRPEDLIVLPAGTSLVRVYRIGTHGTSWDSFRHWGPARRARFDHQAPPPHDDPDRRILYAGGDGVTALVEAFQETQTIDRRREEPWLAIFDIADSLALLDLVHDWPTRAGASAALSTGDAPEITQVWSRAIHEDYTSVHGVLYLSAQRGLPKEPLPAGVPPALHGRNLALYERAEAAMPAAPTLHIPLAHPGLARILGTVALDYRYDLV